VVAELFLHAPHVFMEPKTPVVIGLRIQIIFGRKILRNQFLRLTGPKMLHFLEYIFADAEDSVL